MRVIAAGGGTGGHVTPIKYVARALKEDGVEDILYIGPKLDPFVGLIKDEKSIDSIQEISAGKWRRYPESMLKKLTDFKTIYLNLRDVFNLARGFFQSVRIIRSYKPAVIFAKGGFSSVPVGFAAYVLRVPIVLHDSDALPGLANRVVGRWAKAIAVGQAKENYDYPEAKLHETGVPIHPSYHKDYKQADYLSAKRQLKLKPSKPVIFVLGGSLGALSINQAMAKIAQSLSNRGVQVVHVSGKSHFDNLKNQTAGLEGYKVLDFISKPEEVLKHYLAADIVISRAGATNLAEISALAKPSIIIPAKQLADQQKNGEMLESVGAAVVLNDKEMMRNPNILETAISDLLGSNRKTAKLSKEVSQFARGDASVRISKLILKEAKQ